MKRWESEEQEPNERIHVLGTVDSPPGPKKYRQANRMHGPLFLKQSKIE